MFLKSVATVSTIFALHLQYWQKNIFFFFVLHSGSINLTEEKNFQPSKTKKLSGRVMLTSLRIGLFFIYCCTKTFWISLLPGLTLVIQKPICFGDTAAGLSQIFTIILFILFIYLFFLL